MTAYGHTFKNGVKFARLVVPGRYHAYGIPVEGVVYIDIYADGDTGEELSVDYAFAAHAGANLLLVDRYHLDDVEIPTYRAV